MSNKQNDGAEACATCGSRLYHLHRGEGYLDFVCSVCGTIFRIMVDETEDGGTDWTGCCC